MQAVKTVCTRVGSDLFPSTEILVDQDLRGDGESLLALSAQLIGIFGESTA